MTTTPAQADPAITADRPGNAESLDSALTAARGFLAATAETINPGTPAPDLLTYLTGYRAHLAALVAAAPPAGPDNRTPARLRALRRERGWTQQEIAEQVSQMAWIHHGKSVGVNADMVAKWERGDKRPIPLYRQLLALVLDTDPYSPFGTGLPPRAQPGTGHSPAPAADHAPQADGVLTATGDQTTRPGTSVRRDEALRSAAGDDTSAESPEPDSGAETVASVLEALSKDLGKVAYELGKAARKIRHHADG